MDLLNRRQFCKCSVLCALALSPCSLLLQQGRCAAVAGKADNYYLARKQTLLRDFADTLQGVNQMLTPEFGLLRTRMITEQAMKNFEARLPNLPDVGGARNWDTEFIPIAAWYVSLYESMRQNGKTAENVGKLIYDLNEYSLASVPKEKIPTEQERLFSQEYRKYLRDWAEWTQKRELSANWVAHFIPGNGRDFDYGVDYVECGLVKYCRSQGAPEVASYICPTDFSRSRTYGTGLQRTKTIARGDGLCNFRFKKDRPVVQNWSTELALIHAGQAKK